MASDLMRPISAGWLAKINKAHLAKKKEFQDDADEALAFFNGPYDWLYSGIKGTMSRGFSYGAGDEDLPAPAFRMTVNKVSEMVQLFGPALYHRNPVRKVGPRKLPLLPVEAFGPADDPNTQAMFQQVTQQVSQERAVDSARSALLEHYLNYTPTALDLKTESRWAIDEALIKGMGVLWSEKYQPAGHTMTMVGSFYDTVDNLYIDPDAELLREAKWIARRCVHPHWEVERLYGLPEDSLQNKATLESWGRQADVGTMPEGEYRRKTGQTNDLVVYWKVWSKMGMGGRLTGLPDNLKKPLEPLGDYVYLVLVEGQPCPINIPAPLCDALLGEDILASQAAMQQVQPMVQWPTPFWADDEWPVTPIVFHQVPRKLWPISHVQPGIGELKFLNWAFSFLAGKVRLACRDFIAIAKSSGEELKDRIKHGADYSIIEIEQIHGSIDNVVKFLQHPGFNPEIYKVIEGITTNFERRTGLTELMYGLSSKQIRSAHEAQLKGDQVSIRPDDMASKVEDAMGQLARKEALAARWHLKGQDVQPVMGELGAQWWDSLLTVSDPAEILHQLEYRIEAGSAKKPNKALDQENMQAAMQQVFPVLWQYAQMTGNVSPVNNLLAQWAKSLDLDATGFLFPPMPPPPPPMPGAPPGAPPAQQQPRPAPGQKGP